MHPLELQNYLRTLKDEVYLPQGTAAGLLHPLNAQQMTHSVYKLQPLGVQAAGHAGGYLTADKATQTSAPVWIKCRSRVNPWGADQEVAHRIVARLLDEPLMQPYLIRPLYQDAWLRIEPFVETHASPTATQIGSPSNDSLRQAAQVLSTLHQVQPVGLGVKHRPLARYLSEGLAKVTQMAPELGIGDDGLAAVALYIRHLPNLPWFEDAPTALCHFDPTPGNWLWPRDSTAPKLIDWEYAALSNPWVDLAVFVDGFQLNQAQARYFTDAYWGFRNASEGRANASKSQAEHRQTTLAAWVQWVRVLSQLWSWLEQYRKRPCDHKHHL